ncbi:Plasmodium variant antigen protein Cir/Yir/Bir, putative [Plasmodium chabaudi chabaudi]|uniref:Plasmodium variant antigen protein Cir/Yir/Bir, putative n=2 Tax=Plasmodium chabaudi chabaudi TaxID=31271 RepID=A0A1C6X2I1_PLACU|nr:Plasmodium variant antigen protein Cir/Yir/Bir, putative [Plasmodium chabaudi chabaudi]
MSKELCKQIDEIEKLVVFDSESKNYKFNDEILKAYCPLKENGEKGECDTDELKLGSAFMALIKNFKSNDDENPEDDKLYQYAILWLSYKIKQNPDIEFIRSTIDDILKKNEWYREFSTSLDDKNHTIRFHYKYFINLYNFLKGICNTITNCNESSNSSECIKAGKECASLYRSCLIGFPWAEVCNPYCRVLSNLKKDYEKIREKYSNLPELKLTEGLSECNEQCLKINKQYKTNLDAQNHSSGGSEIVTPTEGGLPGPPVTPTSINNANKLPYIAVPLILIPIILGFSYKYLTPVWRKKAKRKAMKKIINLSDQKKA